MEQGKGLKQGKFFFFFLLLSFVIPPHISFNLLGVEGAGAGSTDARLSSSGQKITHEPWADAEALTLGTIQG